MRTALQDSILILGTRLLINLISYLWPAAEESKHNQVPSIALSEMTLFFLCFQSDIIT